MLSRQDFHIEKHRLFQEQNGRCFYCKQKMKYRSATIDHYVPVACGGTDTVDNWRLACLECNKKKKDTHPSRFAANRG